MSFTHALLCISSKEKKYQHYLFNVAAVTYIGRRLASPVFSWKHASHEIIDTNPRMSFHMIRFRIEASLQPQP